jgi:hypothetical protein
MLKDLNGVVEEWKVDSKIDLTNLAVESSKTPLFHSKYLDMYVAAKKRMLKAESDAAAFYGRMSRYYRGEMSLEECEMMNMPQWQYNKLNVNQINAMLDESETYQELKNNINYWKLYVETTEMILDSLKKRDFSISNAIKFILYTNGAQV